MNKINPLFEAMSNIDDNIASGAIKEERRRPKTIKMILIASAAAAICAITTVTAVASLKAPLNITVDGAPIEPTYSTFADEHGHEWELYVFDMPDYALGEEIEGKTALGEIKAVPNPEYPGRFAEWMIVDEAGNKFYWGINNKLVLLKSKDGIDGVGFSCLNFRDDKYAYFEYHEGSDIRIELVPCEEYDEYIKKNGLDFSSRQKDNQ